MVAPRASIRFVNRHFWQSFDTFSQSVYTAPVFRIGAEKAHAFSFVGHRASTTVLVLLKKHKNKRKKKEIFAGAAVWWRTLGDSLRRRERRPHSHRMAFRRVPPAARSEELLRDERGRHKLVY